MTKLFDNISKEHKEILLKKLEANTITYGKNINILSNKHKEKFIAVIEYGHIQLIKNDYNGTSSILEEFTNDDIFGSMISSFNTDENELITKENTKIIIIDYDQIAKNDILQNEYYVIFIKNLLEIISDKVSSKNERIDILTKRSTRDKLLEYFRILSQKKSSKIFTIPFSFTELANYLCVDRCAMTREIKNLKNEGFIKIDRKKITLKY